ncbi:serine/threonine-protein kinase [Sulfidibacter corallicola]|uniref:Tetratricopeptide repeat protein n=1 Tax=Sulfidibacter corallicola TaxID=2818388 RepID=A0A8A4TQN8_SULCO|nr:serine/threonine-protein kinase [Sulfidibacter corallicola]QTD51402.1 tetratricopeptide repeat protein [Sulfidibacter corallicola]
MSAVDDAALGASVREMIDRAVSDPPSLSSGERHPHSPEDAASAASDSNPEALDPPDPVSDLVGSRCGSFQIEKMLGRGGMGTVYLASRVDDLDLKVALKTLSNWEPRLKELFQRECKILSGLNHPNIAHLIDAGVLPSGQLWLAMEYVEGATLDVYLKKHDLDLAARLELFLKICDALCYAHRRMVIHRDLKPKNILITADGEPKLLDFGIACTLDPDTGAQRTMTTHSDQLMTPEYASPEQIRGDRLNTATDVYSLGVLLYELLAGCRPYRFHRRDMLHILETLHDVVITRPSSVRQKRGTTCEKFARNLRGDLDTITLKALAQDPERRYASVEALAQDLRLHLRGMPIEARPATRSYRLRKFITRHRWPAALGFGTAWFLVLFSFYAVVQQARLERERDYAQKERRAASHVTEFLVSLFEQVDPELSRDSDISAFEVLERGRRHLNPSLGEEPEIQTRLLATLGRVYRGLGHTDLSLQLLTQAKSRQNDGDAGAYQTDLELLETLLVKGDYREAKHLLDDLGQDSDMGPLKNARLEHAYGRLWLKSGQYVHAKTALKAAAEYLAYLPREEQMNLRRNQARLLSLLGSIKPSIEEYRQILAAERAYYGDHHVQVAKTKAELGIQYIKGGKLIEAEDMFNEADHIIADLFGERHPNWIACLARRGTLLQERGDYVQAQEYYNRAVILTRDLLGEQTPREAELLTKVGILQKEKGDYEKAEETIRRSIQINIGHFGKNHLQVAESYLNLGLIFWDRGDLAIAEDHIRNTLEIFREQLGDTHPKVGRVLNNLGILHSQRGQWQQAESKFQNVLAIRIETYGRKHPSVASILMNMGAMYSDQGKYDTAESYHQRSLTLRRELFGEIHPDVAFTLFNLANVSSKKRDLDAAEKRYEKVIAIYSELGNHSHPNVGIAMANLAHTYMTKGKYDDAEKLLLQALERCRETLGENSLRYAEGLWSLGFLYYLDGRTSQAESHFERALNISQALFPDPHQMSCGLKVSLIAVRLRCGDIDGATPLLDRVQREARALKIPRVRSQVDFLHVRLLHIQGDLQGAADFLKGLLAGWRTSTGEDPYLIAEALGELADIETDLGHIDEALIHLEEARAYLAGSLPTDHEYFQVLASIEGKALSRTRHRARAATLLETSYRNLVQRLGEQHYHAEEALQRWHASRTPNESIDFLGSPLSTHKK